MSSHQHSGRQSIDISSYKAEIIEHFLSGTSIQQIALHLSDVCQVQIHERTIQRRLREWKISKRVKTDDTPQLRARVAVLFYQCCLSDKDILYVINKEGYSIGAWGLKRLRKELNLPRRVSSIDREEAERALLETVQKELDKGTIEGLGRANLYAYFRSHGHNVSR
jgi:hypothetical protein